MDGLESIELNFNEVKSENDLLRFDAEYFDKKALYYIKKIKSLPSSRINDEFNVTKLAGFEFTEYFTKQNLESDISYIALTSKNVQVNRIQLDEYITIDKNIADKYLTRSRLKSGDVVLSYTGEYRRASLIYKDGFQLGPNVCKLTKVGDKISPAMLSLFFNSNVGQKILDREKTLSAQPTVAMQRLRSIDIPIFVSLQQILEYACNESHRLLSESMSKYNEAQILLNDYLKIDFNKLDNTGISVKSLNETYFRTGRIDAEYYQVKYDELITKLKSLNSYKLGTDEGICTLKKSIEPGSDYYQDEGIPFIRVSDISKFGIQESEIKLPYDVDDNLERLYPKKDTILFSKDGSIGIAYKVDKDLKVITSGALLHLSIKDINKVLPEYLTLVLNSRIVQMQAERDSNGAIIQHWRIDEISNVLIPVAPMEIQIDIEDKINESFRLRNESEELIKKGIISVEIAVEKSEDEAIKYLESGS